MSRPHFRDLPITYHTFRDCPIFRQLFMDVYIFAIMRITTLQFSRPMSNFPITCKRMIIHESRFTCEWLTLTLVAEKARVRLLPMARSAFISQKSCGHPEKHTDKSTDRAHTRFIYKNDSFPNFSIL